MAHAIKFRRVMSNCAFERTAGTGYGVSTCFYGPRPLTAAFRPAMKTLGVCAIAGLLVACASTSPTFSPDVAAKSSLGTLSREKCDAVGGVWAGSPTAEFATCTKRANDAGSSCNDHSDCALRCLTSRDVEPGARATGQCEGNDSSFGCFQGIANGRASEILCVDPPPGWSH